MVNMIPDLPILGEPLTAEFANTLHIEGDDRLDVLDHPAWIAAWLQQAPCVAGLGAPRRIRITEAARLRALRDAIRSVLLWTDGEDGSAAVEVINDAAGAASTDRVLTWRRHGGFDVVAACAPSPFETLLSAIATSIILEVDRGDLGLISICSRPGCHMFYFRHHHRRRYCNERCANADRQARYNRRLHSKTT